MVFLYIFFGISIALYGIGFMGAIGLPWLKKFNERREHTDFWRAFFTMDYDDKKFAEWVAKESR